MKNPFSLFDFLGYIFPGAFTLLVVFYFVKMEPLDFVEPILRNLPFSFPERSDYEKLSLRISNKLTLEIANIKQRGKKDSEIREAISQLFYKRVGALNNDPDPMSFRISSYNEVTEADALSGRNSSEMPVNTAISEEQQISNPNDIILHTLIKLSKDKNKDVLATFFIAVRLLLLCRSWR